MRGRGGDRGRSGGRSNWADGEAAMVGGEDGQGEADSHWIWDCWQEEGVDERTGKTGRVSRRRRQAGPLVEESDVGRRASGVR